MPGRLPVRSTSQDTRGLSIAWRKRGSGGHSSAPRSATRRRDGHRQSRGKDRWRGGVEGSMSDRPALIRVCYPIFVVTVIALGAIGLVQVWAPVRGEWIEKTLWSLAILAAVSGLVLAGYRTVALAGRDRD